MPVGRGPEQSLSPTVPLCREYYRSTCARSSRRHQTQRRKKRKEDAKSGVLYSDFAVSVAFSRKWNFQTQKTLLFPVKTGFSIALLSVRYGASSRIACSWMYRLPGGILLCNAWERLSEVSAWPVKVAPVSLSRSRSRGTCCIPPGACFRRKSGTTRSGVSGMAMGAQQRQRTRQ